MILNLRNSLSKEVYTYQVEDLEDSGLFYHFVLDVPQELNDGEYDYTLADDYGTEKASGIFVVGNYKSEHKIYNNGEKPIFKQYGQ